MNFIGCTGKLMSSSQLVVEVNELICFYWGKQNGHPNETGKPVMK